MHTNKNILGYGSETHRKITIHYTCTSTAHAMYTSYEYYNRNSSHNNKDTILWTDRNGVTWSDGNGTFDG